MLIKISVLRAACYILSVVTLVGAWYFSDFGATVVNLGLRASANFVKAVARGVASFADVKAAHAEQLVTDTLHMNRTLFVAALMLVWVFVISGITRWHPLWQVRRALFAIVIVHAVLLVAWLYIPDTTSAFYKAHEKFVEAILDKVNAPRIQTFLTEIKLYGLLVMLELITLYSLLIATFERDAERRHMAWTKLTQ